MPTDDHVAKSVGLGNLGTALITAYFVYHE
jgi:hypothetical protein